MSASCMVWSAMGSVAASTGLAAALGTGQTRPQSVTAYSAYPPAPEHMT